MEKAKFSMTPIPKCEPDGFIDDCFETTNRMKEVMRQAQYVMSSRIFEYIKLHWYSKTNIRFEQHCSIFSACSIWFLWSLSASTTIMSVYEYCDGYLHLAGMPNNHKEDKRMNTEVKVGECRGTRHPLEHASNECSQISTPHSCQHI